MSVPWPWALATAWCASEKERTSVVRNERECMKNMVYGSSYFVCRCQ